MSAVSKDEGATLLRRFCPQDEGKPNSKPRRPLFRKRLDAFLDLGAAHAFAMALVGRFLVELAAGKIR